MGNGTTFNSQLPSPSAQDARARHLASGRSLMLTDDFVRVDQLLARLFIERGNR
ncbi:MAG TPA: hypothetical protein VFB92_09880 [Vicinamibacterales bacterium]|nr:hypothetical protein [Vicinamibacterales bacterium]